MAAAAILAAGTASLGIAVTPASATGFGDVQLCTDFNSLECMNGYDGDFGHVKNYPWTPGAAQDTNVDPVNYAGCGGTVTDTCPFTSTTLDHTFKGDSIVSLFNSTNGMVYRNLSGTDNIVETSGGGTGQDWVQHGSLSSGGASFVNIYAANQSGTNMFVCTGGAAGDDLFLEDTANLLAPACTYFVMFGS
jgi:hypothetical protein